jgi:hypothetical protein
MRCDVNLFTSLLSESPLHRENVSRNGDAETGNEKDGSITLYNEE